MNAPTSVPTTGSNLFGDMWDASKGVFKDYIDFESFKFEKTLANDRWKWQAENAKQTAPVAANYQSPIRPLVPWILGAVAIGGAVYFFKK